MPAYYTCDHCHSVIERTRSRRQRFCSARCYGAAHKRTPSEAVERPDGAFDLALYGLRGVVRAYAIIDASDVPWATQWRWGLSDGYPSRTLPKKSDQAIVFLHRELMGLGGKKVDTREIDHRNRLRLDCRRSNLRIVTHAENMHNVPPKRNGTSQYRGVSWHAQCRKWKAQIRLDGRMKHIGLFADELAAAEAAREARMQFMPCAED